MTKVFVLRKLGGFFESRETQPISSHDEIDLEKQFTLFDKCQIPNLTRVKEGE